MKKYLSILLVLSVTFLTTSEAFAKRYKIGLSMQGFKGIFTQYIVAGAKEFASQHKKEVRLVVVDAEDRSDKQVGQVENFVAARYDAIIINPVDSQGSAAAIEVAKKANIPIITVNTTVRNQEKVSAHVGSNDVQAGELQMQFLVDQINEKGNVAFMHGAMGHSAQVQRRIGYMNIIDQYPDVSVVFEQSADWATDKAMNIMENWLQTGKSISAVANNNDTMALGVSNAVEGRGKTDSIIVAGMDAIPDVLSRIKSKKMNATLWQDGIGQGYHAARLAYEAAQGTMIADYNIPYELITQDNIDHYIEKAKERDNLNKKYN